MTAQKVVASSAADAVMIALLPNPEPNQCQFREGAILPSYNSNDNFNCLGTFQRRPPNLSSLGKNLVLVQQCCTVLLLEARRPLKSPKTIFFLMGMTPFIIFSYDKIIVSVSIIHLAAKKQKIQARK